jgi:hypothetical protein
MFLLTEVQVTEFEIDASAMQVLQDQQEILINAIQEVV